MLHSELEPSVKLDQEVPLHTLLLNVKLKTKKLLLLGVKPLLLLISAFLFFILLLGLLLPLTYNVT